MFGAVGGGGLPSGYRSYMASKAEQFNVVLADLRKVPGVEGSALMSRDGILVAADLPLAYNRETFCAMSAAMLGAAETALIEIGKGSPEQVVVENSDTRIIARGVTGELMLVVLAKSHASGAQLAQQFRSASENLKRIVG